MIATAHVRYDSDYFEELYAQTVGYRLRLRKFAVQFATALLLFGIALAICFPPHWIVGSIFAVAGCYELAAALTHKSRWVKRRLSSSQVGQIVDFTFETDEVLTNSRNATASIRYSVFDEFTEAATGFFLIPGSGVAIYIPRNSIDPPNRYASLLELLRTRISPTDNLGVAPE